MPNLPLAAVAFCVLCAQWVPYVAAAGLSGRVVSITDGDTITILDAAKVQHKIRLSDIDAPEKAQDYGTKSREALAEKVQGKDMTVETHSKDRYRRTLGNVLCNAHHVKLKMMAEGWAWHYKQYSKSTVFAGAEESSRSQRLGLWARKKSNSAVGISAWWVESKGEAEIYAAVGRAEWQWRCV